MESTAPLQAPQEEKILACVIISTACDSNLIFPRMFPM